MIEKTQLEINIWEMEHHNKIIKWVEGERVPIRKAFIQNISKAE